MLFPMPSQLSCWHPGGLALTQQSLRLAQEFFPCFSGMRFLDVGCGKGQSALFLREQGFEVYGLDKTVQEHALQHKEHLISVCASAEALPFKEQCFQGILCECVLSLLPNITQTLLEFWRVACANSPGALLVLHDVYAKNTQDSAVQNHFTQAELETALQNSGWKLHCFEEHGTSLKAYAAQLAWYGACAGNFTQGQYGYGLWIATKQSRV